MRVSGVDETMPPIIGPAMRCIISEPAPVLHMMGNRPAMMATTVIILGRTCSTAPTIMAPWRSPLVKRAPCFRQRSRSRHS